MRIASGGIHHESNTYSAISTTLDDFIKYSNCGPTITGKEILFKKYRETNTPHGGYIDACKDRKVELIPLIHACASPSGIITERAFQTILGWFLDRLKQTLPTDGLLLDLHGAMVTEKQIDPEGFFLQATRELVGNDLPIIVTLDLHANITQKMADLSTIIIGYDTYPHVDQYERGYEAATLLIQIIEGKITPVQIYRQLPLITLPPMQCTLLNPMKFIFTHLHGIEKNPEIMTATISMGFPFADIQDAGVSVLVTSNGSKNLAAEKSDEIAKLLWSSRKKLEPVLTPIEDVINFVKERPKNELTIFADGSDNPGGGAPSDGTIALQSLVDANFESLVAVIYDPETALQAHTAGVGRTINAKIGDKTDSNHGTPVHTTAYVKTLSDGRFIHYGPHSHGVEKSLGLTATLKIGNVEVIVSSERQQCLDREILHISGIEPSHKRLIVLKSAVHFRADFNKVATHIFDGDTPGIHRPDFNMFEYKKLRRPIYPLDKSFTYNTFTC